MFARTGARVKEKVGQAEDSAHERERVRRASGVGQRGPASERDRGSGGTKSPGSKLGELAQLGERLVCNQEVTGSSPVFSTK